VLDEARMAGLEIRIVDVPRRSRRLFDEVISSRDDPLGRA
jgi:hypothetical protein